MGHRAATARRRSSCSSVAPLLATVLVTARRHPPAWTVHAVLCIGPALVLGMVGMIRYSAQAFAVPIAVAAAHRRPSRAPRRHVRDTGARDGHLQRVDHPLRMGAVTATPRPVPGEAVRRHRRPRVHRVEPRAHVAPVRRAGSPSSTPSSRPTVATLRNVEGLDGVELIVARIDDTGRIADAVIDARYVFNLAGQVSHLASMADPIADLDLNARSHLALLELLRHHNPTATVVHTSTRQVYGRPRYLPVDEEHPTQPVDINGIAKLAGEQAHLLYARVHGLPITSLRLTNVYGPRQNLQRDGLGFLPVFVRRAMNGERIDLYGDGQQLRDCLYVDDVVEGLLLAATTPTAAGEVFNLGHPEAITLFDVATTLIEVTGQRHAAAGALARGARADRHRLVPRRLRQGTAQAGLATNGRLRRRGPAHGRVLPGARVVPVVDLTRRLAAAQPDFQQAVARVLASGQVLLGPETDAFEAELAAWAGTRHAVAVASGASALQLALAAAGVTRGDEVIVPAFTAVPTASAVCALGAVPVPVDVDAATGTLDPASADRRDHRPHHSDHAGAPVRTAGVDRLRVARRRDRGRRPGSRCGARAPPIAAVAYSFYPTKNLGGIGDGGAVCTDDDDLAAHVHRLRVHGMTEMYRHLDVSQNFRMSELEAAWLRLQLPRLAAGTARRRQIAAHYRAAAPQLDWQLDDPAHVYHLCVYKAGDRDADRAQLAAAGIGSAVHYPLSIPQQPAYAAFTRARSARTRATGRRAACPCPASPS